ncbi:conserved membrane hypothetical protein [Candidatus Terasakiella magnetica]|nr:conserved membrane hypothetical protein [Candidatus Terasakiella magnetica]
MQNTIGLKQPILGIAATLVAVILSLTICSRFDPATFGSWVALLVMSAIPLQIVIGLVWQSKYPGFLDGMAQPGRGIAIVFMMAAAAAIVTPAILSVVGGWALPPTPFVIMYTIVSVCTAFWLVAVFQCWPMSAVSGHPAVIGIGVYVLAYVSAWVLFRTCFDFGAMKDAPFYIAALDPKGAFPAWNALSYIVTTVAVIMWFVMLDFWPTATLATMIPALGRQPLFGLTSAVLVLAIAAGLWLLGVRVLHMDVVDYMVRVPVSALFGEFIMLVMMQTAPFQTVRQPLKGLILLVLVVILAVAMYAVYKTAATILVGAMPSGAPTYGMDLWIATAMLSVTFPVFVAMGDGFAFWPLSRAAEAETVAAE